MVLTYFLNNFEMVPIAPVITGINYYRYCYYYPRYHLYAGIYDNIPTTSHVSSVAAVLYLKFVQHVMLFRPLNMFCTLALSVVCVQCPIWLFF
jgi:hypothetical protein